MKFEKFSICLITLGPYLPGKSIHQIEVEFQNGLKVDLRIPDNGKLDEWEFHFHGKNFMELYLYRQFKGLSGLPSNEDIADNVLLLLKDYLICVEEENEEIEPLSS